MARPHYQKLEDVFKRADKIVTEQRRADRELKRKPRHTVTERALLALADARHHGLGCFEVGEAAWPERKHVKVGNGGGGDYAAQMLLGRMRKAGLVRTQHTEGSSRWEVTPLGMAKADILRIAIAKEAPRG